MPRKKLELLIAAPSCREAGYYLPPYLMGESVRCSKSSYLYIYIKYTDLDSESFFGEALVLVGSDLYI